MSYESIRTAIQDDFIDEMPFTIVEKDNIVFSDDQRNFEIPSEKPWIKFFVRNTLSNPLTVNFPNKLIRREGLVIIQIFTQQGSLEADKIVDQVNTVFEARQLANGLFYRSPTINEVGNNPEGWVQVNVSAAWQIDEDVTIVN